MSSPPQARRSRLWLLRLTALSLSTLIALALGETYLRLFNPQDLHPTDVFLAQNLNQAHAGMLSLRPNTRMRMRSDEFDVEIRIGAGGLRDENPPPPEDPAPRVLVLGDSQTFGYGVEARQTFSELLERELAGEQATHVINAGVPGTGTAQQLQFLEETGWNYRPALVIVALFPFNDIGDNGLSRLFAVRDGRLQRVNQVKPEAEPLHRVAQWQPEAGDYRIVRRLDAPPPGAATPWLVRRFHLARLVRTAASNWSRSSRDEIPWHTRSHARELSRRLIAEVRRQCEERGVEFLAVVIPALEEYRSFKPAQVQKRNRELLSLIPASDRIDLWPLFRKLDPEKLFYRSDLHLNPEGHRAVAAALKPVLRNRLFSTNGVPGASARGSVPTGR